LLSEDENLIKRPRGRRPGRIFFDETTALAGISLNTNRVTGILINLMGKEISRLRKNLSPDDDPVVSIKEVFKELYSDKKRILSLGISFPGFIDSGKRKVIHSVWFSQIHDRDLAFEISESCEFRNPIIVERNAICDISCDYVFKRFRNDALLISLVSGVSAALLIDETILHGKTGNIGELGHLPVAGNDIPCKCGRVGCLETLVGGVAWGNMWARETKKSPESFARSINSSKHARQIIENSLALLFSALEGIMTVLSPQQILFSTDIPPEGAEILQELASNEARRRKFLCEIRIFDGDSAVSAKGAAALGLLHFAGRK
jgi:glucokinase